MHELTKAFGWKCEFLSTYLWIYKQNTYLSKFEGAVSIFKTFTRWLSPKGQFLRVLGRLFTERYFSVY